MKKECENCDQKQACPYNMQFVESDSYIEEIFIKKCTKNNKCKDLLLDWIDSKTTYARYTNLSVADYGNYSKHDSSHSIAILNSISSILGKERVSRLNTTDLWLILHGAYGHDVGMPYSFGEMRELWSNVHKESDSFHAFFSECLHSEDSDLKLAADYLNSISSKLDLEIEKNEELKNFSQKLETDWPARVYRYASFLNSEYIRRTHAKRSQEMIERTKICEKGVNIRIEPRFYKLIARICMLHTANNYEDIYHALPLHEWELEGDSCHPRFAAFMLRLGDLLDIDNNRFDLASLWHFGNLPKVSELHKKKHEAIEHIKYTEKTIEITARSDEEQVCQYASDWFSMLKSEVTHIVFNWNRIAPECLEGCTLSEPHTAVYLKDKLFYRIEDCEFKVDKETLIELVIGRNLYKTQFDFLKEYIQNAIDAVKMRFWIEMHDGNMDFFIKSKEKMNECKRKALLPFELEDRAFDQYAIDIVCSYLQKDEIKYKEDFIRIEIIDKGIGIDRECITAISNIGSGWKRRKKYAKYIENMPKWLKPTGGFGIGMQSGFMITNEVHIETRCEEDAQGRMISLYSNKRNGRIEERECPIRHIGTKIIVDIPYKWFMDTENYKEYPELKFSPKKIDFFDSDRMMVFITRFIQDYVSLILGNPLFPVHVRQKECAANVINGFFHQIPEKKDDFIWHDEMYQIYSEGDATYIWERRRGILCSIKFNNEFDKNRKANWYFKGVRVWTPESREENDPELYEHVGDFNFDIMGLAVKECLTIDRNRFINEFEYNHIANEFAIVYLNYKSETRQFIEGEPSGMIMLNCLLAYKYVETTSRRANIRTYLDDITKEQSDDFNMRTDMHMSGITIKGDGQNHTLAKTLFQLCLALWGENKLWWGYGNINDVINLGFLEEQKLCDTGIDIWDVTIGAKKIAGPKVSQILKLTLQNGSMKYSNKNGCIFYYQHKDEGKTIPEDKEFIFTSHWERERREIFYSNDYFKELQVTQVPFNMEDGIMIEKKKEKKMIISPVPAMFADQDFSLRLREKEHPEEDFIKLVTEDRMYEQLIDWTYTYQIFPQKYSKEKIDTQYRELLQYIFDINMKPLVYNKINK